MCEVVVPEADVNGNTPASTLANICLSTSVTNPLFTAVSNISATGGSNVVSRTKQSTLLLEGNVLKLGPELNVSCQLTHSLNHNSVQVCVWGNFRTAYWGVTYLCMQLHCKVKTIGLHLHNHSIV